MSCPTDRLAACMRYVLANSRLHNSEISRLTNEITIELLELEAKLNALSANETTESKSKVIAMTSMRK